MIAGMLMAATAAVAAPDFSWIGGDWLSCAQGEIAEEHWAGPSAAGWVSVALTRSADKATYEHARIGPIAGEGGWAFHVSANGAPTVVFRLTRLDGLSAVFENPAHDFPKRVRYWREGDLLKAAIDAGDGKGPSWSYHRRGAGETC